MTRDVCYSTEGVCACVCVLGGGAVLYVAGRPALAPPTRPRPSPPLPARLPAQVSRTTLAKAQSQVIAQLQAAAAGTLGELKEAEALLGDAAAAAPRSAPGYSRK
jgi:hypothetical protein